MRVWPILLSVTTLGLFGAGGAAAFYHHQLTAIDAADPSERILRVDKGVSQNQVGAQLVREGFVRQLLAYKLYLRLHPEAPKPKAGRHPLNRAMDLPALIHALSQKPLSEDQPFTLVEGWRLEEADKALAEAGLIEAGAYLKAAQQPAAYTTKFAIQGDDLLGYLLPETYRLPPGKIDPKLLIQRQLDSFYKRFVAPNQAEIEASERSLRELVILASMLEREEPNPKNRPMVAGVLANRLKAGHPLGVDATSRFSLGERWRDRKALLKALRDPDDPFNTRLRPGLPPGPIGAPSLDALMAALRPKKNPYWYYLHDADKKIHFAKTAAGHEANRRKYNVW